MSHTCTPDESNTLHFLAQSLRPDWKPNRPGVAWQRELGMQKGDHMILQYAEDFHHAFQALMHYAIATRPDGNYQYRTPNMFPHSGEWWTATKPDTTPAAKVKLPPCEQHPEYGTTKTCSACRSEILAGHRPDAYMGKIYNPTPKGSTPNKEQHAPPMDHHNPETPAKQDENTVRTAAQAQEG